MAILAGGLAAIGIIGSLDWNIKSEISVSSLYLLPICFVAWFLGLGAGLAVAMLAAMVWLTSELFGRAPLYGSPGVFWQFASRLVFFVVVSALVSRTRAFKLHLEALVRERTAALAAEVVRRKELEKEAAEIADQEQERVAHELHDQLAAYLSGIAFRVKTLAESLDRHGAAEAAEARNLVSLVNDATDQVRNLARLLAPVEGNQDDLEDALSSLGAEVERVFGITCALDVASELPRISNHQVHQLYRIAQEAVRNAIQHAQADLVEISVRLMEDQLQLVVGSDGKKWKLPGKTGPGLGLRIMRHRTERLGGRLAIEHGDGGRTVVTCEVPTNIPRLDGQEHQAGREAGSV
jgi:signal transduction histidine kinase